MPRAQPSGLVIALWRLVTAGSVLLTGAMITHRSEQPVVAGRYSLTFFAALLAGAAISAVLLADRRLRLLRAIYATRWELLVLATTVAFCGLALEALVRTVDPLCISYYAESYRYQRDKVADPYLIYRHPRSTSASYQGVQVRYNELGLREAPIGKKQPNEYRVVFLGDSI